MPGYEEPPYDDLNEYPRTIDWEDDEGWAIVQDDDGHYVKYYEDGTYFEVDQYGEQLPPNGSYGYLGQLLYVDDDGNAYFRGGEEGSYNYFMVDHDGGMEYVQYEEIPGYEDLDPPTDGHIPYFFDVYPNVVVQIQEPDGEPIFANGTYQQTYNDGQIVVTWSQEGGPYHVRYYSEENAGGYLQLDVTYDVDTYSYETHVYPYDYFDHIEEDFELQPIDHYVDYAYLGVPYDNMEISNNEVEYYWYDEDGDLVQKTTVDRVTGEVTYQYDDLYIHVDQNGYETYDGNPDPNWMPPEGYEPPADDLYPPYGMPPYLVFGEGYDYEMQYLDPDEAGYELLSATPADDPTQWQYIGPNGERVIVSQLDEYTYQYVWQTDPNAPPGQWEMVMNVTTDQYGNYVSYEAVDGEYYDEYYEPVEDYGGVIPEGAPPYFGDEQWVNPEQDNHFEFDSAETDANGAVHYLYTADFDDNGDIDYKIDVIQYPDGHVEVEYHSTEYGHEATYEIITQPNGYYGSYVPTYYVDDPQGVPEYEPEDGDYPRIIDWDAGENWVILDIDNGMHVRYDDYRPPYFVDEQGNEITGQGTPGGSGHLISVDLNGNAYFQSGEDYYVIGSGGGFVEVEPNDIPGYDYEALPPDDYEYPRTIQWDAHDGWAIVEDENGYHYKLYEDGGAYFVDQYGNETPTGDYYVPELVQVDAAGNAYMRQGDPGNYSYAVIDQDGGYEPIDVGDIPDYDPDADVVDEYYEADWAEHYDPNYGYEHPYDLYGQPDPPGENQDPHVYTYGGGRAMVVHNEDGSETITWYSEGGYQNGYVEYQATVEYEGGQWVTESVALPTDQIPVYGIWPVEGSPVYDPYHPDAPWGEPESVTILEDRVIAIWNTDEGQIRSEWYRDGSHAREVTYPDGLVISWSGDTWEYDVPEDWTPPDYDGVEPDSDMDADGPEGVDLEDITPPVDLPDLGGDAQMGERVINWNADPDNAWVQILSEDGQSIYEYHLDERDYIVRDAETGEVTFNSADGGLPVLAPRLVYVSSANGTATFEDPYGNEYYQIDTYGYRTEIDAADVPTYEMNEDENQPEDEPLEEAVPVDDPADETGPEPWTDHLSAYWNLEIGTGQHENFYNPEAEGQYVEYDLVSENATERVYVDQFGQYVRIVDDGGGNYTFSWGEDLANPDLVMGVPYEGDPVIEYTSIGVVDPWDEEAALVDDEPMAEMEPIGPEYYVSGDYQNPNYLEAERVDGAWSYYENNTIAVQDHYDGTETVMYGDGQGNYDMVFTRNAATGEVIEMVYWPDGGIGVDEEVDTNGSAAEIVEEIDPSQLADADSLETEGEDPEADADGEPSDDPDDQEDLQFLTEEEVQTAEAAGEEPLEFNGPEIDGTEGSDEFASDDAPEELEPVEIAQPEPLEALEDIDPITSAALDEADLSDDGFDDDLDDDDDDDGSGF